jgi:hypothetical protein
MKRIIILTGIILLAVSASAQRRAQDPKSDRNHKSEASSRPNLQNQRNKTPGGRTIHTQPSNADARRSKEFRKPANTGRKNSEQRRADPGTIISSREAGRQRTPASGHAAQDRTDNRTAGRLNGSERNSTAAPERIRQKGPDERADRSPGNELRRHYTTPDRRQVRSVHGVNNHYRPVKYRKIHYRSPAHVHVIWTRQMYHEYRILYPDFRYWYYPVGYTILTVPAYNAALHIGEVRNVYGRVHEVWYSWDTDEYFLYFGGNYPFQDFTVILPGRDARRFSRFPEAYFEGRYIWVTGLVSTFEGKPELMVKRSAQVHLY